MNIPLPTALPPSALRRWAEALVIALCVALLFVLFALLVLWGILPGEFIHS